MVFLLTCFIGLLLLGASGAYSRGVLSIQNGTIDLDTTATKVCFRKSTGSGPTHAQGKKIALESAATDRQHRQGGQNPDRGESP